MKLRHPEDLDLQMVVIYSQEAEKFLEVSRAVWIFQPMWNISFLMQQCFVSFYNSTLLYYQ